MVSLMKFVDNDDNDDDDSDDSNNNICYEEQIIIFSYTFIMLSSMNQHAYIQRQKQRLEEDGSILGALLTIHKEAKRRRYPVPRHCRPRVSEKARTFQGWFDESDRTWFLVARMSKDTFTKLLHRIGWNPIFHNNSSCPQAPVQWQLLVALSNFGLYGNGGSYAMKAKTFSLSEGSVENYTRRCIHAILELEGEFVKWPNAEERAANKEHIGRSSWFKDCIGFIDGTLVPLAYAPSKHKEDYYTRKSIYALNSLIICDDRRMIMYAHHGWCGSAHDQRVLKSTTNITSHFSEGEYIVADSGYASVEQIVPVFKRSRLGPLSAAQNHFNMLLSKIRIASEHCNGMLQMRFGSLHELRLSIGTPQEAAYACDWIAACVVMHNFLIVDGSSMVGLNLNTNREAVDNTVSQAQRLAYLESLGNSRRDRLFRAFCIDKGYT